MERSLTKETLLGTGAGYAASKVMDRVTTAYQERQSESSRRREKQLQEEPAYTKAAEKLAEVRGRRLDPEEAEQLGQLLHFGAGPVRRSDRRVPGRAGHEPAGGRDPHRARDLARRRRGRQPGHGIHPAGSCVPTGDAHPRVARAPGLRGHPGSSAGLGSLLFVRRSGNRG